jgi:hypothetical protein
MLGTFILCAPALQIFLCSPSPQSAEEAVAAKQKHTQQFHRDILSASLELMVNLFREVTFNLNVERSYFNLEGFLQSQAEEDRQFYQEVCTTCNYQKSLLIVKVLIRDFIDWYEK